MKRNNPRVTVVIPCHNNGEEILRCISSIQQQSYAHIDVIIVDDGSSSAETLCLLSSLEKEVRLIRHSSNQGLPTARNTGFAASEGDFVLFLDADDWYEKGAIEAMVAIASHNSGLFFVYCDMTLEGSRHGPNRRPYRPYSQLMRNGFPYSIMLFRQDFESSHLYDTTLTQGLEDWDLNIRLISRNFIPLRVESPLFHYSVSSMGMFQRHTLRHFFQTWRYIRSKNKEVYSRRNLCRAFRQERKEFSLPSMLPAIIMSGISRFRFDSLLNRMLITYLSRKRRSD